MAIRGVHLNGGVKQRPNWFNPYKLRNLIIDLRFELSSGAFRGGRLEYVTDAVELYDCRGDLPWEVIRVLLIIKRKHFNELARKPVTETLEGGGYLDGGTSAWKRGVFGPAKSKRGTGGSGAKGSS